MPTLTILQINDLHGYLETHPEYFSLSAGAPLQRGGGVARVATLFRQIRRETDGSVLALDSGDTFHGTMAAVHSRGDALVAPIRALKLDAMTIHWEMVYGLQRVRELRDSLGYPVLAANFSDRSGQLRLQPFSVVERGGLRVGVIGLAAIAGKALLSKVDRDCVDISIGEVEVSEAIKLLRSQHAVELVVLLSHLGFPQDCKLASRVSGIDVVLSGHTHNRLTSPAIVNGTLIIQSGAHGAFVGRLDLDASADGVAAWTHRLIPVDDSVEPDVEVAELVDEALAPFRRASHNVLGETETVLHRYSMLETSMDDLLLAATAEAAGTAIALSNGWRYGAPVAVGPVTEADVWNIVPANPPVSTVELTGAELWHLLENNVEATFSCDPWEQRGGYLKRSCGIEVAIKLENPSGFRLQTLSSDGRELHADERLTLAFLGAQAIPDDVGRNRKPIGISAVECLTAYLRRHRSVGPRARGSITLV